LRFSQKPGPFSEYTIELTFKNDEPRDLEGELDFPLDESAVVVAYAVDVCGQLVDAAIVEREQARAVVQEEILQQKVMNVMRFSEYKPADIKDTAVVLEKSGKCCRLSSLCVATIADMRAQRPATRTARGSIRFQRTERKQFV
jgi:hypothetical protein